MQAPEKTRSVNILRPFLKLFFFLLYHPLAWAYDLVASLVSAGRWKKWILHTKPFLSGQHILELGHGPGHLQAYFAEDHRVIFGIDRSRQMGQIAYRRLSRLKAVSRLTRANADALPFSSGYFDTIVATFPTEYISNPATMLEIYRLLSPGGKLVVLLSAWITGGSLLDRALARLFQITGQTRPTISKGGGSLQQLKEIGFDANISWIELPTSRLLMLIAEKRQPSEMT
jgi:ubiquinone/menaquinone biosynthesis C-methylase UbiE